MDDDGRRDAATGASRWSFARVVGLWTPPPPRRSGTALAPAETPRLLSVCVLASSPHAPFHCLVPLYSVLRTNSPPKFYPALTA